MEILSLFYDFWGLTAVGIGVVVFFVVEREQAKEWAYNLVLETEKNAKEYALNTLDEKRDWVYAWYDFLPKYVRLFVPQKVWNKFVDWAIGRVLEIKGE